MSSVTVYTIDNENAFHELGDANNASAFHVSIWNHLGIKYGRWPAGTWGWWSEKGSGAPLDRLWADIALLSRADGLAMAATCDRCWFPWDLLHETADALTEISAYAATAGPLAEILRGCTEPQRGFTFASSLASSWSCRMKSERWHHHVRFGKSERTCRRCDVTDVDNAALIVRPR